MQLGMGMGLGFNAMRGGGGGGPTLADLPVEPASRWHPEFSSVTIGGGRVVSASDLEGLAVVTEGDTGIGPLALTDGLGRKFWRFEGDQALVAASTLALTQNAFAVFMVVRAHRVLLKNPFFAVGTVAGSDISTCLDAQQQNQSAANLRTFGNYPRDSITAESQHTVVGSQMQVIGMASRSAAAGQQAIFHNGNRLDVGRTSAGTAHLGATIGYGTAVTGSGGQFDVYDIVVYAGELSNAQCASVAAALQAGWNIPNVTNQLVLEGDSITQGTGAVSAALNCSMVLTEPGTNHIPANWRVTNYGASGNQVANLVTRRDRSGNSWTDMILPGQNVMAFEIGRNDWAAGVTAAQHYANVVAYLNTTTTGVLQQGWHVRAMANIATAPGFMTNVEAHRAALRNPQFLTDTLSGTGQTFEGRVSVVSTDLIEDAGQEVFRTSDDAADSIYYAGDSTHPSILGAAIRVTGGDTPQYGIAFGLT